MYLPLFKVPDLLVNDGYCCLDWVRALRQHWPTISSCLLHWRVLFRRHNNIYTTVLSCSHWLFCVWIHNVERKYLRCSSLHCTNSFPCSWIASYMASFSTFRMNTFWQRPYGCFYWCHQCRAKYVKRMLSFTHVLLIVSMFTMNLYRQQTFQHPAKRLICATLTCHHPRSINSSL